MLTSLLSRLDWIGQPPDMHPEDRLPRRLTIWMGVLMSGGGVLWSSLSAASGFWVASTIPAAYVVITAVNLWVLDRTGAFERSRNVQVGISMLLPFLAQLALGGFMASGAIMLWSLLSLVASVAFQSPRRSALHIAIYACLTSITASLDPVAARWAGAAGYLDASARAYLVINALMVGVIIGVLAALLDHLRRSHNEQLIVANSEILCLNDQLQAEVERAERAERVATEASQAKSSFLANMSHELRTPLNAIIGYAELMEEDFADAAQDAARIQEAGRHLLTLVNDVLNVAKIEAGMFEIEIVDVDLAEVVAEMERTLTPIFDRSGNKWKTHTALPQLMVRTDPVRLRQILINLLSNANKFTEQGTVGLAVAYEERVLRISVTDNGIGMTADEVAAVREPFRQADASTTRKYGGTGLGLHLVDQLVGLMGGSMDITSTPGAGTSVDISLPADPSGT